MNSLYGFVSSSSSIAIALVAFFLFSFVSDAEAFNLTIGSFAEGFKYLYGGGNFVPSPDGRGARLLLDQSTGGSGFISSSAYEQGFFSAKIKLPSRNLTAGVVVTFYTSNGDVFKYTHDELDFEFLGHIKGQPWTFQTNLYGNGSTDKGREERYNLWFDPTTDFHRYSILWTPKKIIFFVDDVPIREVIGSNKMGAEFPAKPMSLYATIWDGSAWATSNGKHKINYKYAPFVAEYKDLVLDGCPLDGNQKVPATCAAKLVEKNYTNITHDQRVAMSWFRNNYMYYSYCYNKVRYPIPPPECVIVSSEKSRFTETGNLKSKKARHY